MDDQNKRAHTRGDILVEVAIRLEDLEARLDAVDRFQAEQNKEIKVGVKGYNLAIHLRDNWRPLVVGDGPDNPGILALWASHKLVKKVVWIIIGAAIAASLTQCQPG